MQPLKAVLILSSNRMMVFLAVLFNIDGNFTYPRELNANTALKIDQTIIPFHGGAL